MFYHSITEFGFLMNILGKLGDLPFSRRKEKRKVSFTHVQNIICNTKQAQLDGIAHEQTIICSAPKALLFVGSYLQVTGWALGQWK